MNVSEPLTKLHAFDIQFVLIGGTALILYGSRRVTLDLDIAVKTLDIDAIIGIFSELGLKIVTGTDDNQYPVFAKTSEEARAFAEKSNWGFLKFLSDDMEIDVLYDIPLPFMHLYREAQDKRIQDIDIKVASLSHLRLMKSISLENREDIDKKRIDEIDLDFIDRKLNALESQEQ